MGGILPSGVGDQGVTGHFVRFGQIHQLKNRGRKIGQSAGPQSASLWQAQPDDRHQICRMGRVWPAGDGINHHLAIAMIGGDNHLAAAALQCLNHLAKSVIHRFASGDCRLLSRPYAQPYQDWHNW